MGNNVALSIAIPTYNRAQKLTRTLDSILEQIDEVDANIEIVISDNCSTDNTADVVKAYQEKYPFIKYYRNSENKGIDYNICKCPSLSEGEFVHLLSDDDILMEGALASIVELIKTHPDVSFFYLNGRGFDLVDGEERSFNHEPVLKIDEDMIITDKNQFLELLGVQITFISAFLLNRKAWNINTEKSRFIGTDIYLSYDLIHLLANSHKYMFVAQDLIGVHKDYTPGNYRIFYAFGYQWRKLLLEEAVRLGFDKKRMRALFENTIKGLVWRIKAIKRGNMASSITIESFKHIFLAAYDTKIFWRKLLPALLKPAWLYSLKSRMRKKRRNP